METHDYIKGSALIIGASGFLGSCFLQQASASGYQAIGTYSDHKIDCPGSDMVKMDLSLDDCLLNLPEDFIKRPEKVAVFCAAVSLIDYCGMNKELTYKINVENTEKIMRQLSEQGFRIVFISSDYVFDGTQGNYSETDKRCPVNEYGRHKHIIEKFVCSSFEDGLVVRISKLCSAQHHPKNLFNDWYNSIKQNQPVYCIKDNVFSPTTREDVVKATFLSISKKFAGIYNIAGAPLERFELARRFVDAAGFPAKVDVFEKKMEEFNFVEERPLNSSLDNRKFIEATNFNFTSMERTIQAFFSNIGND